MKKLFLVVALICAVCAEGGAQKRLTLLYTNDTHSTVMPLSANLDDTLKAGRGGFVRRVALVAREREKDADLLLFDSGDFSQGSPFYTLFKGDVEIGLMNRMGYDAVAIGNHEFDFGLYNMARLLRMASFPVVCANYDFSGTPVEGLVKPYVVLHRKGLKIGVFGLSPKLNGLVSAENYKGVRYENPIEAANRVAALLKDSEGCDVVVCLSHLGWNMKKPDIDDATMIGASRNIDVVLGGHSHSYFDNVAKVKNADGKDVVVDQNGKHAIYVGKMELTIQNKR